MQIFKSNEFFCGLSIPDPGTIEPVEKKLPRELAGAEGVDFMKVLFKSISSIDWPLRMYFFFKKLFIYAVIKNQKTCEKILCELLRDFNGITKLGFSWIFYNATIGFDLKIRQNNQPAN